MTTETMGGVACAHKKIVDNGKEYTLLAIVPRSAGYELEWGGNFVMNDSADDTGDSAGFKHGKDIVLDFEKSYIETCDISGDIKVWTAGYSRGAGVINQVGAALINRPNEVLGDSVTLAPENLYCYTYGTPRSASAVAGTEGAFDDPRFNYIHNVWMGYDIVTVAPPAEFGFNRYGTNYNYAGADRKDRMLDFLKVTNDVIYDRYMNGGDPDNFAPKTIDIEKFFMERTFAVTDDPDSYLPASQTEFMELMGKSIYKAVGSREAYYSGYYQAAMKDLAGYVFSHLNRLSAIVDGLKEDRMTPYLVGFMYLTFMLERYADTKFNEDTIAAIQGGNLSPLLSNIMLNELDKELEARGLRFTRYADDCVIAVKSEASAKRVMRTVTDWIQRKLGLKVNMTKTHITKPQKLKYLGFGFYKDSRAKEWKCRPHQDSVKKFKSKLKELTCRKMPGTVTGKIAKINQVTRGWINYYALGSMKTAMAEIDAHLRTRLRIIIWKQWKVPKKRQWGLQKLGVGEDLARLTAYCGDRYYWVTTKTCVVRAISKEVFAKAGLISCLDYYNERHALKLC